MHETHLRYYMSLAGKPLALGPLLYIASIALSGCQAPGLQRDSTPVPVTTPAAQAVIRGQDELSTSHPQTKPSTLQMPQATGTLPPSPIQHTLTDLPTPGSERHHRLGMPVSGQYLDRPTSTPYQGILHSSTNTQATNPLPLKTPSGIQQTNWQAPGQANQQVALPAVTDNAISVAQGPVPVVDEVTGQLDPPGIQENEINTVPLDVQLTDTPTGRFMFGVGVNSDAGLTGQIMINERNFNYRDFPMSLRDITNGRDFRDGGQGLRIEAMPGNLLQRYMFMFTDPYFVPDPSMSGHDISLNVSGFYYDRRYWDWAEQRLGGRVSLGYRITDDLSLSLGLRAEKVTIHSPRVVGVPQLDEVLGDNDLYSGQLILTHDTRDIPFMPTEGHYVELTLSQSFGKFSFPRADIDLRRHFLLKERADGSGRQTLSFIMEAGFSGSNTPIFERYFAGGFSSLRGFDFRGASPVNGGVVVGGDFRFLTSIEYLFPLTADDMLKGVAFCDLGTVEENIALYSDSFRVSPGFGLRISVPMLGPAPLALDLAFPLNYADTDQIQNFSFFMGVGRG